MSSSITWAQVASASVRHLPPKRSPELVNDSLCLVCAKIDFHDILAPSSDGYVQRWKATTTLGHIKEHVQCPFCRLLLKTLKISASHLDLSSADFSTSTEIGLSLARLGSYVAKHITSQQAVPQIELHTMLSSSRHGGYSAEARMHMLAPNDTDGSCCLRGRRLGKFVTVDLLRDWLQSCQNHHREQCNPARIPGATIYPTRVIDVVRRCIVPTPTTCDYVALSYVWGAQSHPQLKLLSGTLVKLTTDGGIADDITPATILDAMKVTKRLSQRYIWVDALCILQDDRDDQVRHFENMHTIYANSVFTIASVSGNHSWSGLPGVSPRSSQQVIERIGNMELANVVASFPAAISPSAWNSRAWTMQEMIFATRVVYFTEHQAYFQCNQALWREEIVSGTPSTVDLDVVELRRKPDKFTAYLYKQTNVKYHSYGIGSIDDTFAKYCMLVNGYAKRAMTKADDILNAFNGVLATMSEALSCDMLWGLPSSYIDRALMFTVNQSSKQMRRRQGFPSWSWSGWQEPPDEYNINGPNMYYTTVDVTHFWGVLTWYTVQTCGILAKVDNSGVIMAKDDQDLRDIWPRVMPRRPQELAKLPARISKAESSRLLVFQSSCCSLKVERRERLDCYYVMSTDGQTELTTIDSMYFPSNQYSKQIEFTVIAIREGLQYEDGGWKHIKGYFTIMAICTDRRGLSKRLDIAHEGVSIVNWLAHNPKWRTVFLL